MANLATLVKELGKERDRVANQLSALDAALKAFVNVYAKAGRKPRGMSAAARRKISLAQKARWAKVKGRKVVSIASRQRISAAGLARIRAAQRARWAKVRAKRKS